MSENIDTSQPEGGNPKPKGKALKVIGGITGAGLAAVGSYVVLNNSGSNHEPSRADVPTTLAPATPDTQVTSPPDTTSTTVGPEIGSPVGSHTTTTETPSTTVPETPPTLAPEFDKALLTNYYVGEQVSSVEESVVINPTAKVWSQPTSQEIGATPVNADNGKIVQARSLTNEYGNWLCWNNANASGASSYDLACLNRNDPNNANLQVQESDGTWVALAQANFTVNNQLYVNEIGPKGQPLVSEPGNPNANSNGEVAIGSIVTNPPA